MSSNVLSWILKVLRFVAVWFVVQRRAATVASDVSSESGWRSAANSMFINMPNIVVLIVCLFS